jgi:hypothetical protein
MANYTIAVGWSGKDALADSDAGKVISGADFNTEFTAVQTAVNTKADLAGSATQAFAATTASPGTNTTQVASTAFVTAADVVLTTALAPKASPALTGTPTAPTAATATDTTQIATTAFVQANTPAASSSTLGLVKASLSGTTLTIATS